jgi:hypothetical protein
MSDPTNEQPSAEELRADIERTREDLAQTVDALTDRLDVKARAQARAGEIKASAQAHAEEIVHDPRSRYVGIGLAVVAVAAVAMVLWKRKR